MRIGNTTEPEDYPCESLVGKFLPMYQLNSEPPFGAWSSLKMWTYAVTDSIGRKKVFGLTIASCFVYTGCMAIKPEIHAWFVWLYFGGKSVIAGRTAFRGLRFLLPHHHVSCGQRLHGTRCGVGPKNTTNWKRHAKLLRDAGRWLDQTDGLAKVVLATRADRRQPRITIRRWQYHSAKAEIEYVQTVEIIESSGGDKVTVIGGPLLIPFHLFSLRPAEPLREDDILIDEEELRKIVKLIWEIQFSG